MRNSHDTINSRADALIKAWGRQASAIADQQADTARRSGNPNAHILMAIAERVRHVQHQDLQDRIASRQAGRR